MSASEDSDVYCESIRIESKVIYADLRVNARGQYLKLSETGSKRPRSTVLLPASAVKWVYSLLDYYIRESAAGREAGHKELAVENKVFHFSVGSNERGRFLRISESGVSQLSGRHTLIIPCGGDELNGWVVLRDCIRRVGAVVEREAPEQQQLQQQQQQQSQPVADAQHAGEGGSEPRPPPPPPQPQQPPVLDVASSLVVGPGHPPPTLTTSPQGTPVLSCNGRRVFFDIGSTSRGHYMRITEAVDTVATLLEQRQQQQPHPQQAAPPPPPAGASPSQAQAHAQQYGQAPPQQRRQPQLPHGQPERQGG
ncbi:Transcription factor Pur-alpha 1 [Monoraphidium neglectum]|uniref:Transcription factor Pur-alpha 1 n=1 Tax=Monoraphidium neglectum TaxID=145388 RepID=A0A0D2N6G2_9CHLO|nr:Transcription factor Pur-alpha 1 [Monoraphidium neglectum]KIZ01506.1 Transcription factor Pur-alpha 1 [Monoraphidium neglectum]|eukprot:XP_013900525.1 Transcription factor Pur-alpha 1 [Monoraphidium neglectum]